jgi:hypothetical protein
MSTNCLCGMYTWHVIHKVSSSGNLSDKFFSIFVKFIKLKDFHLNQNTLIRVKKGLESF